MPWPKGKQRPTRPAAERFWAKVVLDKSGCSLWQAHRNEDGYGTFWTGERRQHNNAPIFVLAHRWVWEASNGPIPDGLRVLHHCDTPACVHVDHLFLGTQADNVADCAAKGRRNQARYQKLSAAIHAEIQNLHATGEFTLAALGRRYGVTYQTIRSIVQKAAT